MLSPFLLPGQRRASTSYLNVSAGAVGPRETGSISLPIGKPQEAMEHLLQARCRMMGHGPESGKDAGRTVSPGDLRPSPGGGLTSVTEEHKLPTKPASLGCSRSPSVHKIHVTSVLQRLASRETQRNLPSMWKGALLGSTWWDHSRGVRVPLSTVVGNGVQLGETDPK